MGVKILIADDHEVVRQGVRKIIEAEADWEVCAEANNGNEAVTKALDLRPEIIVMDLGMAEMNGLEATRQILQSAPKTQVLILTMHQSEALMRDVLEAGARGYMLKSDAGRDLVTAIQALREQKTFFTPKITQMVVDGFLKGKNWNSEMPSSRLTPRERQIVQLLAEGKSNKQVAGALHISVSTAETHRTNIMRKLNFHTLTDLVHFAIRNHIVEA
ncbi:MAG: response regulator [Terriglobales bacterium]